MFQFGIAGFTGFLVDAGTVLLLRHWTSFDLISAKLAGFSLAVTVTWLINRNMAFAAHAGEKGLLREWAHYVSANGVGGTINNGVYVAAVLSSASLARHPELAVAMGAVSGMSFNYAAARWWVFRRLGRKS